LRIINKDRELSDTIKRKSKNSIPGQRNTQREVSIPAIDK